MHSHYEDESSFVGHARNSSYLIYPNPVKSFLSLRWKDVPLNIREFTYQVIDYLGKELLSGSLSEEKIDVGRLPEGLYLIILQGPEGRLSQTFIKE